MWLAGLLTIKGETIKKSAMNKCIELIVTNWQIKSATSISLTLILLLTCLSICKMALYMRFKQVPLNRNLTG